VILSRKTLNRTLRHHRVAIAAELADAIDATAPPACDHRDRPSCPKCATRRTALASATLVREKGTA
jgi:hypothetical protein